MPLLTLACVIIIVTYVCVALLAPVLAPFGQFDVSAGAYQPWDKTHKLGTDNLGRDILSRLMYGLRNSLGIALVTAIIAFLVGVGLGVMSAVGGGWLDQVLSRLVDVLMAIPGLIFALLLLSITGPSIWAMITIIALVEATRIYRLARGVSLNIATADFVEAARIRGEGLPWIIAREIVPNATAPLLAEFGLRFSYVFLFVSALSFLGLGIQPPFAELGSMVRDNAVLITYGEITPLLPAATIAGLTVSVNILVDWYLKEFG